MKKILITGYAGYIGKNLVASLNSKNFDVFGVDLVKSKNKKFIKADITDPFVVDALIARITPDVIIHLAGLKNQNVCESNKEKALKINFGSTVNFCESINNNGLRTHFIYMSSDYVFDGFIGGYSENSIPQPNTNYGMTKYKSEVYIEKHINNYTICRTSSVFGNGGGFIEYILNEAKKNNVIEAYVDSYITPTYIKYLLKCIDAIIKKRILGIIHISGSESISRFEFAHKIKCLYNLNVTIKPITLSAESLIAHNNTMISQESQKRMNCFNPTLPFALNNMRNKNIYPYFSFIDDRGLIQGICNKYSWEEINYIESIKGVTRGNHYHKKTTEGIYLIKGAIKVKCINLKSNEKWISYYRRGEFFIIEPFVKHSFYSLEDSSWINFLTIKMLEKKDIYK